MRPVPTTPTVFFVEIEAHETAEAEVEALGADIRLVGTANRREQHCHGVLGNGIRRIRGHAHNTDPLPGGVIEIDVVISRAPQSDHPNAALRQTVDHRRVYRIVDKHAHAVISFGKHGGILGQLGFKKFEFNPRRLAKARKGRDVIFLRIKKSDLHCRSSTVF